MSKTHKNNRFYYSTFRLLTGLVLLFFLGGICNAEPSSTPKVNVPIKLAIKQHIYQYYEDLIKNNTCDNLLKTNATMPRGVYETVLLCRALNLGGITPSFKYLVTANYNTALNTVITGKADISAETVWQSDTSRPNILSSSAVIESHQLEKGIFAIPEHPIHRQTSESFDIKNYKGVTVMNWFIDIALLNSLTPHSFSVAHFNSIFPMLKSGEADFVLLRMTLSPDQIVTYEGVPLKAVQGIKVALPGSRHYIISRKSRVADVIGDALNKGLDIMKETGELERHLQNMRVTNSAMKDWKVLNLQ